MSIVRNAKEEQNKGLRSKGDGKYYELHHILPKSLFPNWKRRKTNLVLLTAKEHYFVHELLYLRVITAWKEATNLINHLKESIGDNMKYTLKYIRVTRSTNVDLNKLNRVNMVAKKYEAAAYSDYDSQFQVYESVKQVQELIQNFVEECNADYSVDRVRVVKSNMLLGANITLDPFSDNPIPVSICFEPYIEEALSRDAKYLESQLY